MLQTVRRFTPALGLAAVVLAGTSPAFAAISATGLILPRPYGRNAVAFDSVNRVYLMAVAGFPIRGQFLDQNGNPVGGLAQLTFSEDGDFTGAATVTFGGPPSDPTFLVTFRSVRGSSHLRYGRLVRYRPGQAASVGPAVLITDMLGDWFATEKGQALWNGSAFVVGTKVGGAYSQPYLHFFNMNSTVTGGVLLGDQTDYQANPSIACGSGVCMATGYAAGTPWGWVSTSYARRFDPNTLQPIGGLFHLDDHSSPANDPVVTFNRRTGRFISVWWQADYAMFRTMTPDGSLGPLGHRFGPGAGDLAIAYNGGTQTTLLATKWGAATLHVVELDDSLAPSPLPIVPWDGSWPEYTSSLAVDEANGRWLATAAETAGGRGAVVFGAGGGGGGGWRTPMDFNADGARDVAVWRPSNGVWYVRNQFAGQWGWPGDVPVPGDYNGDGRTDVAVWRPSDGVWYVHNQFAVQWGWPGDVPVPGDYNGDGVTDIAVWRPSNGVWYVRNLFAGQWGWPGDVPVPGDYNGDGLTDVAVWRPSDGVWYVHNQFAVQWGWPDDVPVPGDYNGDGVTDVGVWRPSNGVWYVRNVFAGQWGWPGDVPVPGDYNGDGRTDVAVWRPSDGVWYVHNQFAVQWGWPTDVPVGGRR